jgi:hypothetical protein
VKDELKNVNLSKFQVSSKHPNRELLPNIVRSHRTLSGADGLCPEYVSSPQALGYSFWCVFPHLSSTDIPFSSYPLKAKYVELMGKDKGYKSSHVYCQVKEWSKKSYETFSNNFGKGSENDMMEGEKMDSRKKILKLKCFLLSKY